MTSALQNRLVGTIIVVALIVIFVPEFLDGEKRTNKQDFVEVPPVNRVVEVEETEPFDASTIDAQIPSEAPLSDEVAVDAKPADTDSSELDSSLNNEQVLQNDTNSQQQNNTNKTQTNQADVQDALSQIEVKDSGWVVQLGSFGNKKNVRELVKTLKNAGYRAYTRPIKTSSGELTKVFVGPELDKEKLELALPHLQELTRLKGKITAFEVSAQ